MLGSLPHYIKVSPVCVTWVMPSDVRSQEGETGSAGTAAKRRRVLGKGTALTQPLPAPPGGTHR